MSKYGSFEDPYCYPGSIVLRNRRGLRQADQLAAFELGMTRLRAEEPLPTGKFDPAHYRTLHRHLFGDVYDWAGEYRMIRIAKRDAMFCFPEHIAGQMDDLFPALRHPPFTSGATREEFTTAAARFLGDLNAIHLFREGNGRTQLTFLFLLGVRAGHGLDMTRIRPQAMLAAMIASFRGEFAALEEEIERLLA